MTELTPPPVSKSRLSKILLAIVLVLATAVGLGYYASRAGLDKALVKQELDAWIERSESNALEEGYNLDITYEDVAIKGGLTDGHASIRNIKIVTQSADAKDKVTFKTDEVKLEPKSANLRDVEIILPTPIHVFENKNTYESAAFISETPLLFSVERLEKEDQPYRSIAHEFPSKITLKFLAGQDASGEEDKAQELTPRYDIIEVSMESGSAKAVMHEQKGDIGDSVIDVRQLKIVPVGNELGTVTIARFNSRWSNHLNKNNLNQIEAKIMLEEMNADASFMPFAPINMNIEAAFEGAMPDTPEDFANLQSQQNAFKLKQLSFSTKDAAVNATADFVSSGDDILPVGMANLSIDNVQSWREILKANEVLRDKDEELINTLFIRIAGQTLPAAKNVAVDIQRTREGAFQIGNITFEELLAILLGNIKTPLDVALPEDPETVVPTDKAKVK
jgi:hypothetical protein